jgi:predicted nucleic acid-binding protein
VSLVLDASVTMAWYFEHEGTPATEEALDHVVENSAVVPAIWRFEVGNALQAAIRHKRIDTAFRDTALVKLSALPITIDVETDAYAWTTTLRLSERFGLTLYDAAYLELAQRRGVPLATLDQELCTAARSLGVPVLAARAP